MVVTPHPETASRIAALRNHGRYESGPDQSAPGRFSEAHAELGFNYRLSEIQCALGLAQLARLDAILARRDAIARRYCELLAGTPGLVLPAIDVPGRRLSWFVFVVRLADRLTSAHRDRLCQSLSAAGIATGRYFAPIHLQPAYAHWRASTHLPVTESVADRTLALPFFNRLADPQIQRVATELQSALRAL